MLNTEQPKTMPNGTAWDVEDFRMWVEEHWDNLVGTAMNAMGDCIMARYINYKHGTDDVCVGMTIYFWHSQDAHYELPAWGTEMCNLYCDEELITARKILDRLAEVA